MRYDTVIFDLDGTLLDTLDDLHASVNFALEKHGFLLRSKRDVRSFLGNGIRNLVECSMPAGASVLQTDRVFEDFKAHYIVHCEDQTRPYEGIPELLEDFRKRKVQMAIVSNKADNAVKELAEKYFSGFVETAIGERQGVRRKPEPDSVFEAMKSLAAKKEKTLYVGDSEVDRKTAENAGLDCVLVSWGFREEDFLHTLNPEYLIHRPEELVDIVNGDRRDG